MQLLNNFDFERTLLRHFVLLNDKEKEMVRKWRNSKNLKKWFFQKKTISQDEHLKFIENLKTDKKKGYWLVILKPDLAFGVIYLNKINIKSKFAQLGLYANPDKHIAGAGNLLMDSIFNLAFEKLCLKSLQLVVFRENLRAIKLYGRWGFKKDNKSEKKLRHQNINHDNVFFMSISK